MALLTLAALIVLPYWIVRKVVKFDNFRKWGVWHD